MSDDKKEKKKEIAPVEVDGRGVVLKNFDDMWRVANALCHSRTLPQHYNTPEKVFAGIQVTQELGLPMVMGMSKIYLVNGVPNLWGDLPLALCRQKGVLDYFEEYPIDSKGEKICEESKNLLAECFGYVCKGRRKGSNETVVETFTMKDAERAGLVSKKGSLWRLYPKNMLKYKARSLVLKNVGADVLYGVDILEHRHHVNPDLTPKKELVKLNSDDAFEMPDYEAAEKKLREAKTKEEMMAVYEELPESEREHCRELSRELVGKFDNQA